MTGAELNSYRLSSHDEPTDEQLQAIMEEVGEEARKNSDRVQLELDRRMQRLMDDITADKGRRQITPAKG